MKKFFILLLMSYLYSLSNQIYAQNIFTHKLGKIEFSLLSEGQQNGNTKILIDATPEILQKYAPEGTFPNAVNTFLIHTLEKNILIDTGFGRNLFNNLDSLGISANQIDIVLLTHMHGDHIGGMLRNNEVSFPNAEVYIAQPEYDYWMTSQNEGPKKVIEAYKGRIHLFQPYEIGKNISDLIPGVQALAAYGHTPGHTAFLIESDSQRLLVWGDLTHAMAIQMPHPEIAVTYDANASDAVKYRQQLLEFTAKNKIPIAGMHIAFPGMGTVSVNPGEGYLFEPFSR